MDVFDKLDDDYGPLPLWGWGVATVVVVVGAWFLTRGRGGSSEPQVQSTVSTVIPTGPVTSIPSDPYGTPQVTNDTWSARASMLAQEMGYGAVQTEQALATYLAGADLTPDMVGLLDKILPVVGRPPDAPGMVYTPVPDPPVVAVPVESEWGPSAVVKNAYRSILGREPDEGGMAYWGSMIESGALNAQSLEQQLRASPEAKRYQSDSKVRDAYRRALGREVDPQGLAYWSNLIESGQISEQQLVTELTSSVEARG